ncbi:MAG: N-6 DNA methylase [Carboxylicivirga sp.]|jgi:type I restriction enzyme M protein|nr:N-6 DNA methylase [Carboxylicivirga sp.]
MDKLGRFYTDNAISELLVNQLDNTAPKHILDLGVGDGSLLSAALNKWQDASYSAVDIEDKSFDESLQINFLKKDVLNNSSEITIELSDSEVDIAICNPPYTRIKSKEQYNSLFKEIGFINSLNLKYITTDLLFLAFNLSLLKDNGQLGIILPDTLITSSDFKNFRKDVLKYDITTIIELPGKIFRKTEAKTYILIINKSKSNSDFTNLLLSNKSGQVENQISVSKAKLIGRMDYTFNLYTSLTVDDGVSLNDLGAVIKRGKLSGKLLRNKGKAFFHTSDFTQQKNVSFTNNKQEENETFANKGDVLLARVGSRCLGKFCVVESGRIEISDCILKVTLSLEYVTPFVNALSSDYGKSWFKAYSHGVCAKLISKKDLLNFKIPIAHIQAH